MISKPNLCNMKQGWEIKKLGEVCDILNGLWIGKKEPFVNICVIRNTNFTKDCKLNLDNVAYIDAEEKQFITRKLLKGDIIIEKSGGSEKQPVGRVVLFNVVEGDYSFSNFTSVLRINQNNKLDPGFLHKCLYAYYLRGETLKLQSKTTGLHNLDMKGYLRLNIPIPSLAEQERIVAELDCLSGVIEKKKQQLKELDALTQSIFYEMFGDPVKNNKGWDLKGWKDVFDTKTGKLNANAMVENGKYPFFTCSKEIYRINTYSFDCEALLLSGNNATANYDVKYYKGKFNAYQRTYILTLKDNSSYIFFKYALENQLCLLQKQSIGGLTKYLTLGILNIISFIVPPLSLQQAFASKIETIEKQKELIKQSIKEVETLFNSRMDYYFN